MHKSLLPLITIITAPGSLGLVAVSYTHLTGYPHHNQLASVTILSKKSIDGEIETTRLFFADGPIENWLTENPEVYGAIFISKDKKIKAVGIPQSQIYVADQSFEFE